MVVLSTWSHPYCQFRIILIKPLSPEPKSHTKLPEIPPQSGKGKRNGWGFALLPDTSHEQSPFISIICQVFCKILLKKQNKTGTAS